MRDEYTNRGGLYSYLLYMHGMYLVNSLDPLWELASALRISQCEGVLSPRPG